MQISKNQMLLFKKKKLSCRSTHTERSDDRHPNKSVSDGNRFYYPLRTYVHRVTVGLKESHDLLEATKREFIF